MTDLIDQICLFFGVPRFLVVGAHPNDWVTRAAQHYEIIAADKETETRYIP